MILYLFNCIEIFKLNYYNYLKHTNQRMEKYNKDQKNFNLILKIYKFKKRQNGARQIMMVLNDEFKVHFNKKIRRLIKKTWIKMSN